MEREFARRFAAVWKQPAPERLVELLHPDVVLYQPRRPPIRGREAAYEEFRRFLRWLPGFYGEVQRSSGAEGLVFIEWEMKFPIGRGLTIGAVDRFTLRDGLGLERIVYFNQLPLLRAILAHPRLWPGFWQYRRGRG